MITFKHIRIEGFASISRPFLYNLDSTGVNLIVGKNGAGKSTIFNALTWALYGKTLKPMSDIETWENLRVSNYQGTKVEVTIRVGLEEVTVIRCKNYKPKIEGKAGGSNLFLYINGELYTKHKNKNDITKKIQEILGMSLNLFKNSITFGQNLTRLLREKGDKQKELFDEAFSITYINKARENAKDERTKLEVQMVDLSYQMDNTKNIIKGLEDHIEYVEKLRKKFLKEKQEKMIELIAEKRLREAQLKDVESLRIKSDKLNKKIEELKLIKFESHWVELSDTEFKLNFELKQIQDEYTLNKSKLREILTKMANPKRVCPTCGQPLSNRGHKDHIQRTKKELEDLKSKLLESEKSIKRITGDLDELSSKMGTAKTIQNMEQERIEKLESYKKQLEKLEYYPGKAKDLKIQIEDINNQLRETAKSSFSGSVEHKQKELERQKQNLTQTSEKRGKLEKQLKLHNWVINDALSNKGLKAYVFNSMLSSINKQLRKYGTLGWTIEFLIDLDSGNKNFRALIYQGNEIRPYEDLSGGEQQLVDLCLAFSIHDVIAEHRFNILLMDEVFESLDKDNIELVIDLIKRKTKKNRIHIVTHRKEFVTSSVKVLYLDKTRSKGTSIVG